jgi:hypothetical protein
VAARWWGLLPLLCAGTWAAVLAVVGAVWLLGCF